MDRPYGAVTLATVGVVLGLGIGACAQDAPDTADAKSSHNAQASVSPTPGPAEETADGPERVAVTAYRAMWKDAEEAARTADPKHPRLDDHAEKSALWLLQHVMEEARKAGATIEGTVDLDPTVVKSGKDKVELRDCIDGSKWVQVKPDSSPDALSGGRRRAEATVVRTPDGKWVVSDLYWEDVGTCIK